MANMDYTINHMCMFADFSRKNPSEQSLIQYRNF